VNPRKGGAIATFLTRLARYRLSDGAGDCVAYVTRRYARVNGRECEDSGLLVKIPLT